MYRPDDWKTTESWLINGKSAAGQMALYEAGATAMLEGLKKEGDYLNGDTVIPAQGKFPEIHCPGGMIGWLVFIPEDK